MNSIFQYKKNKDKAQYLKRKIKNYEYEIIKLYNLLEKKENIIRKMAMDHSAKEVELHREIYQLKNNKF